MAIAIFGNNRITVIEDDVDDDTLEEMSIEELEASVKNAADKMEEATEEWRNAKKRLFSALRQKNKPKICANCQGEFKPIFEYHTLCPTCFRNADRVQCSAITRAGTRCTIVAEVGSDRCRQHLKMAQSKAKLNA